jgi:hypothetical protein
VDYGERLCARHADAVAITAMVAIAGHRGWSIIMLKGSASFRRGRRASTTCSRSRSVRPMAVCALALSWNRTTIVPALAAPRRRSIRWRIIWCRS